MTTRKYLHVLSRPEGAFGDLGFKLTGIAKEGDGLCRVWLRRVDPWDRYLDSRAGSDQWDVRAYTKLDSAFEFIPDFNVGVLAALAEDYEFPDGAEELAKIEANGDLVHDQVLAWARNVTGAPELGSVPQTGVLEPEVRYDKQSVANARGEFVPAGRVALPSPAAGPRAGIGTSGGSKTGSKPAPTAAAAPATKSAAAPPATPAAAAPPATPTAKAGAPPIPGSGQSLKEKLAAAKARMNQDAEQTSSDSDEKE